MASNYPFIKLKELCVKITKGSTPTKTDGGFSDRGINFIKAESASYDGVLDDSKFVFVTDSVHEKYKRSQLEEKDILFSMAGAFLGKTGIVETKHLPANTNQALALIRVNNKLANPKFVLYCLQQRRVVYFVNNSISQSAQPNINLQQIGDLDIDFPDRKIQDSVVEILDSVVQSISLNQQTNQTLEQMAQTLFKSWFVDFDPVFDNLLAKLDFDLTKLPSDFPEALQKRAQKRLLVLNSEVGAVTKERAKVNAKASLQNDSSNTSATDLAVNIHKHFPSELEHNEQLGWIPKGWECKQLDDLVEIASSKRVFAKDYVESGVPFYRGKEITELSQGNEVKTEIFITEDKYQELKLKAGAPKAGDILITSVGTIGNAYLVHQDDKFYFKDGNLTWIKDYKKSKIAHYIITWLRNPLGKNAIENIKIGTTQQAITIKSLNKIKLLAPTSKVSELFESFGQTTCDKLVANNNQNNALVNLRDTLLPKLISGELELPTGTTLKEEAL